MADKHLKIFIASSKELKDEREHCILMINQLNKSHKHLHLEPVEWEIDMVQSNFPGHETIQDAINPKLRESDLVVFIFYSKIGKYTREEFDFANKENKRLFAFFKTGFSPEEDHQFENYKELKKFRKSLNDTILYKEYDDLDNFEKLFYPNLNLYLVENHPPEIDESDRASITALSQSNQQLIQLLAGKEEEIKILKENINQLPDAALQIQINELLQEKEAIRNELLQSEEIKKQLAKDKDALEKQLAPQIEHDALKALAFEELEKENYAGAENYLMQSAKASVEETASTFFELAKIKKLQLQYSQALQYYELAAKISSNDANYLFEAACMANDMGFYDRSIDYSKKSLAISKKKYSEDHSDITDNYFIIGKAYLNKGEYNEANKYYKMALKIDKRINGEEHSDIAVNYNDIGMVFMNIGQNDKAIEYLEQALSIGKKVYGEEHPFIATFYNNIGMSYFNKEKYSEAAEFFEKSLSIDKKFYGEEHPSIAVRYNNIGGTYRIKGEYNKAIEYYKKALEIDKKFLGEEHPDVAIRYNNIGVTYYYKKNYPEAVRYLQKALLVFSKFLPESHPNIRNAVENIELAIEKQKVNEKP